LRIINLKKEATQFDPDDWISEMDSTQIALPEGSKKLQGVPVWKVIDANSTDDQPNKINFISDNNSLKLNWSEIQGDDNLRIFSSIEKDRIVYVLAEMSGNVRLYPISEIIIE
jgi:hypothetical protein